MESKQKGGKKRSINTSNIVSNFVDIIANVGIDTDLRKEEPSRLIERASHALSELSMAIDDLDNNMDMSELVTDKVKTGKSLLDRIEDNAVIVGTAMGILLFKISEYKGNVDAAAHAQKPVVEPDVQKYKTGGG
jgi:hypothetical protein